MGVDRNRVRCRALHHLGRVLFWWSSRPRIRGTEAGHRAVTAAARLCEVRELA